MIFRTKPPKVPDAATFEIRDDQSGILEDGVAPTVVSAARTSVPVPSVRGPLTSAYDYQRPLAETRNARSLVDEPGRSSASSLYSDHTVRPYVPSRYTSSRVPPKAFRRSRAISQTGESLANKQLLDDASEISDEHSMLEENNTLRQELAMLRQQLVCLLLI